MKVEDFSPEEQEQETGFFANQAQSEFKRRIEQERYNQRLGKVLFLRQMGRKERLKLSQKYGKSWQESMHATV